MNYIPAKTNQFFTCTCCGKEQNLDQSVHISQAYCVSCFNKEQMHREVMKKIDAYNRYLQESGRSTKIRKNKVKDIILLNEILLPQTIFSLNNAQIAEALDEKQKAAIKVGLNTLRSKYNLGTINEAGIINPWIQDFSELLKYKSRVPKDHLDLFVKHLDSVLSVKSLKDTQLKEMYTIFKKAAMIPYFTSSNSKKGTNYQIKYNDPFGFNREFLLRTTETYRRRIQKQSSQLELYNEFLDFLANDCQFQTMDDMLKIGIQRYVEKISNTEADLIAARMMNDINQMENSHLIPNIAKYIMDNHEYIFESWYTKILPFDKRRFTVDHARTGSRTDFVVRLNYRFVRSELKSLEESVRNSTAKLLKEKANKRIKKIRENKGLSKDVMKDKIDKINERLDVSLEPANLKIEEDRNAAGYSMVARYLLINAEKAFNMILNKIIRYHYKRLKIKTEVQYITNVLESGADEKRRGLNAYYIIQSREW